MVSPLTGEGAQENNLERHTVFGQRKSPPNQMNLGLGADVQLFQPKRCKCSKNLFLTDFFDWLNLKVKY